MKTFSAVLALMALCLVGCGGQVASPTAKKARMILTVNWPVRGRVIPEGANSIKILIKAGPDEVASRVLVRPVSGSLATTATFTDLPAATVMIAASAYPTVDATGTAQASGSLSITLDSNVLSQATILLGSTIDHLVLSPATTHLDLHTNATYSVSAFDADGNLVLTSADKWTWSTTNANLTLTPSGNSCQVTGASVGSATLTAKETESGKQVSLDLTVSASGGVAASYTITELCPFGQSSYAMGLNDSGKAVGHYHFDGPPGRDYPFSNDGSGPVDLPHDNFPGFSGGGAVAINNSGKIVGGAADATTSGIAVWYPDGSHRFLAHLGQSGAIDMNAEGQIVGIYRSTFLDDFCPAVWDNDDAEPRLFTTTTGGMSMGIADGGTLAYAVHAGGSIWDGFLFDGQNHALEGSEQGSVLIIHGMNGNRIVGVMGTRIALWTGTSLTTLGEGSGEGINASGVIVGTMADAQNIQQGFIYTEATGLVDLKSRVSNLGEWSAIYPTRINSSGLIIGSGLLNGSYRAFILRPN